MRIRITGGAGFIGSNTSSLPEIVGDAGVWLLPDDQDGLCQARWDFYRHPGRRAERAEKSLWQARRFSWANNVRQTVEVYELAASRRGG